MPIRRCSLLVVTLVLALSGLGPLAAAQDTSSASSGGVAGFRADAARTGFIDELGPEGPPAFLWRAEATFAQTMSAADDAVAVHSLEGISLFDAETGELRWQTPQEPSGSAPVIAGDAVYVGSANGFRAYALETGELRWEYFNRLEGDPNGPPIDLYDSSPAYVDGTIYVGSGPYAHTGAIALDAETGELKWRFDTQGGAPGSPAVADGLVYIASEVMLGGIPMDEPAPSRIYAIEAETGDEAWSVELEAGETVLSTPAVADGVVVIGVTQPDVSTGTWRAFDAETGDALWSLPTTGGIYWTGAAVAEGIAFLNNPDMGEVVAVDLQTGEEVWRAAVLGATYTSLTVSRDAVYVPVSGGMLVALDRETGAELWSFNLYLDGNSVTLADGKLYLERGGSIFALTDADDPSAIVVATPPDAPVEGPGAEPGAFAAARVAHFGDEPGGFWIVEPDIPESDGPATLPPLPVLLYLTGCCGNDPYPTPEEAQPWLEHLARSGYIVIAPVYDRRDAMATLEELLTEAMQELESGNHATPDYERFGVIGFSFGGPMAVTYTAQAADMGLPVPKALFVAAPCEGTYQDHCVVVDEDLRVPAETKAVMLVFSDDTTVGNDPALKLWGALDDVSEDDKDFVTMTTDEYGFPTLQANHETAFNGVDASDRFGIWKLSTALADCALMDVNCEYALGDTPEQTGMGEWSDGMPITPLTVTDDPGAPSEPTQ